MLAHGYVLAFMMEAGLNRQRLEFSLKDLKSACDRLGVELVSATRKNGVCR